MGQPWHLTSQAFPEYADQKVHPKNLALSLSTTPAAEFLVSLCRYKKNIKALYIVHPTMFIKTLLILFKPIIR